MKNTSPIITAPPPSPPTHAWQRWAVLGLIAVVAVAGGVFFSQQFAGLKATVIGTEKIPVFITSQTFKGNIGSIAKADEACQRSAEVANLDGKWMALLSAYSKDIKDKLQEKNLADKPFVLTNGEQVAANSADLFDGSIQKAIIKTEFEEDSITNGLVWTGTGTNGKRTDYFCQKGFQENKGTVGKVDGSVTDGKWVNQGEQNCNVSASLYCLRESATGAPATLASTDIPASGLATTATSWTIEPSDTVAPELKQKGITKITINFKSTAPESPKIAAKTFRRLTGVTPPSGKTRQEPLKTLRSFELTPNTALKNELKEATIEFKMSEKEITQNNLHKSNLRIGKFHNGKWREFTPTCSDSDASNPNENMLTCSVNVKEFSTFIISSPLASDPYCGDGAQNQDSEQCDDGNSVETDACSSTCVKTTCGDGVTQAPNGAGLNEQCDDGNTDNTDACIANTCKNASCGDGFVRTGVEQCDDGNTVSDDGCSATCTVELIENKVKDLAFQDLVAYYPFEDAGQEVKDTSGNNRNGKIKNVSDGSQINQTLVPSKDVKKFGKALQLGPERYVDLGDIGDFNDKPITITFWAKPEKIGTTSEYGGKLFAKMTAKEKGWKFDLKGDKFVLAAASNENDAASYDRTEFELGGSFGNSWMYLTLVLDPTSLWNFRDSSKMKFYLNGSIWPFPSRVSGSRLGFQGKTDIAEPLLLGGNFTGLIDDVRLYNRALSENEIQKLYNAEVAICGNAILDRNEPCDDGNTNEDDGCNTRCELPVCGDGKVQGAEQCENGKRDADGKPVADATCSASCRKWGAGITIVQQTINDGYPAGQQVVRHAQQFAYRLTTGNLSPQDFVLDSDLDQTTPYSKEWGTWRNPNTVESGKYVFEQLAKTGGYPGFRPSWEPGKAATQMKWTEDKTANSRIVDYQKNIVELNLDPGETIILTFTNYLLPECSDGADNDGDGKIDFKADGTGDPSCDNANDNDEKEYLPTGTTGKIIIRHVTRPTARYDANSWDVNAASVGPYFIQAQPDNITLKKDATPGTYKTEALKTVRNTIISSGTPEGFTFQGIQCEESVTPKNSSITGQVVNVVLDANETVTCDYIYSKNQVCQNGIKDPWEQCDDGDEIDTNACSNKCELPRCGDTITQPASGEQCDDGNTINTDACTNTCKTAVCGDNIIRPGIEECDDNNTANGDGCDSTCKIEPGCGNNHVDPGEQCDDGNTVNTDTCTNTCRNPSCGDGFKQAGEACDDGDGVNNRCTNQCQLASCGDGILWEGVEQCDDGNDSNTDGCSTRCNGFGEITLKLDVTPDSDQDFVFERTDTFGRFSYPASSSDPGSPDVMLDDDSDATLKNSFTWTAESRSGGHAVMLQNLPAGFEVNQITWVEDMTQNSRMDPVAERAIDIALEPGEKITVTYKVKKKPACSDGIDNDGDGLKDFDGAGDSTKKDPGCDNPQDTSEADPVCGNGEKETGEECDDGNASNTDGCIKDGNVCKLAKCGDGFTKAGAEACDDGNTDQKDACLNNCSAARCGDGFTRTGVEACDLGDSGVRKNGDPGEQCSLTCKVIPYPIPRRSEEWNAE